MNVSKLLFLVLIFSLSACSSIQPQALNTSPQNQQPENQLAKTSICYGALLLGAYAGFAIGESLDPPPEIKEDEKALSKGFASWGQLIGLLAGAYLALEATNNNPNIYEFPSCHAD